jgi:hypothetical protein
MLPGLNPAVRSEDEILCGSILKQWSVTGCRLSDPNLTTGDLTLTTVF